MFPSDDVDNLEIITDFPTAVIDEETVWIPLSDGVRLAARIWRPGGSTASPIPAILEMIPYRYRDGNRAVDQQIHPYFAGHGYASVRVDLRGTGNSEGHLADEYLKLEQDDGLEIIAWIAEQDWCDGQVGMMGLSWGGFNSLQVAARRPPALKAIIAVGATVDRYNDDVHYKQGSMLNENFGWGTSLTSLQSRPPDPDVVGGFWRDLWLERLEKLPFYAEPWLEHAQRDSYWQHGSVSEEYAAIECPVFVISGWADAYINSVPRLLENLSVPCQAVAGPWAHHFPHLATPGPAIDFLGEAKLWWDRWLKGQDLALPAKYRAYIQESDEPDNFRNQVPGRWLASESWPLQELQHQNWYLGQGGLEQEPEPAPPLTIASPVDLGTDGGELVPHCLGPEMPLDQRIDDGISLIFDSAVLAEDLDIWGDTTLTLTVSSSQPDADLIVRLCDVAPNGQSERVTWGTLRLAHRIDNQEPLHPEPGEPIRVQLQLNHVGHRFKAGRRLRVALSSAYFPLVWPTEFAAELTLMPEPAILTLPLLGPDAAVMPVDMQAPKSPSPVPLKVHQIPENTREVIRDQADRSTRIEIIDDFGNVEYLEHGLMNRGVKRERYWIAWGDPGSASAEFHWTQEVQRDDWQVRTELRTHLQRTDKGLHCRGELEAFEWGKACFSKRWDRLITQK
jgi:hypothetical protein